MVCAGLIPATIFHFLSDVTMVGTIPTTPCSEDWVIKAFIHGHTLIGVQTALGQPRSLIPVCVTCIGEESRASVGCMGRSCRSLLPDGADCFGSGWQCAYLNVLPSWLFLCLPGHLWPLSCGFDHESCTLRLAGQEMEVPSFRMP